jgi:hypothetical protein
VAPPELRIVAVICNVVVIYYKNNFETEVEKKVYFNNNFETEVEKTEIVRYIHPQKLAN